MKRHFKSNGIIIRKVDFNEADRIVTVLTDEFGKIDCIAKGARRLKSKFCGRLELFYNVNLTCFQGRELANLNEVHLLSAFPEEKDVNKHRILFYIAELTNKLIQSDQQIEGVYPMLLNTLQHLESNGKYEVILHAYLIKLLTLAGFLSPWNRCGICSDPLNPEHLICLSATDAHVVCQDCCSPADNPLSIPLIKWVNFMQNYPLSDALKVKVNEKDHHSVWLWLQGVLGNLLTSPIKSEGFLQQVG